MGVLNELLERRNAASAELDTLTAEPPEGEEKRDLTSEEEDRATELVSEIDELDARLEEETRKAKRARTVAEARKLAGTSTVDVSVVDEPMVYGPGSSHSFYADLVRYQGGTAWRFHEEAGERLRQWGHQVEREIAHRSKKGAKALGELRELNRSENGDMAERAVRDAEQRGRTAIEEKRSIASGGGASASAASGGAAFVTPVFFVEDYAPYREYGRAFADQVNKQPLPDYGMNVYIPAVQGPAGVDQQSPEGNPVNETDPTFGYLSGALITLAGQVTVSQQLLDRAGPNFSFDRMIFDQLMRAYAPQVDTYALNTALTGAGTITYDGSFSIGTANGVAGFYAKVSEAKATIRTTDGVVLNPTHLFLTPTRWEYIAAWADGNTRPLVVPDYAGPWNAAAGGSTDGDAGIEGNTGYRFNGLRAFADQNIPNQGTTSADQAIVGDLNEVYLFEGTPVTRTIPQTYAQNLQTILQLYSYVTEIVRYPHGVQVIQGTAMSAPNFG